MNHVTTLFNSNEFDEEDKLRWQIADTGQKRDTYLINESGLYSLILKSKMPSAKKFKRWVTSEVLPQIRKTGSYDLHIPKTLPEALRLYADEVEAHNQSKAIIEQQKQQIAEYEPKVDYVDKIFEFYKCNDCNADCCGLWS